MSYAVQIWKLGDDLGSDRYVGPLRTEDTAETVAKRVRSELGQHFDARVVWLESAWNYDVWTELHEWATDA